MVTKTFKGSPHQRFVIHQIEITNDVMFLLPIMVAVMVAKVVADTVTHSLYHAQLEVKCVPFLDAEPVIVHEEGDKM